MSEKPTLKERWQNLSPGMRIAAMGGAVLVALILILLIIPSGNNSRLRNVKAEKPIKADMLLPRAQDRTVEQLSGGLTANQRELAELKRTIRQMKKENAELQGKITEAIRGMGKDEKDDGINSEVMAEIQKLNSRIDAAEAKSALNQSTAGLDLASQNDLDAEAHEPIEDVQPAAPAITVIGDDSPDDGEKEQEPEDPAPYITANSMFEGELLNGMDAPTDQSSRRNPVPAVLRIKSEAILPNMFNIPNIKECFLSVSGYGDMADERAKMRTEMLSCVVASEDPDKPPKIVEAKVDGYLVGEDGRVGLRGRLVSKQGQIIAKTLLAGTLSGFAEGLKPQQIQGLDLNPSGNYSNSQTTSPGTIAKSGLAQGVSDSAKSVSSYLLKMADQMMPIVEIDAGRKVTVVLLKGVELK